MYPAPPASKIVFMGLLLSYCQKYGVSLVYIFSIHHFQKKVNVKNDARYGDENRFFDSFCHAGPVVHSDFSRISAISAA
jgi:hypothetical protein